MNKRPIVGELPVKILQPEVKLSKPIHPKGNRKEEYVDLLQYICTWQDVHHYG